MEMTTERKRDGGIVAPAWWPAAASAAKRDRGLVNEQIAEKVAPLLDLESIDVSRVTRCLNGSTATIPLMDAISTVLGIPPPVYVAQTVDEAAALSLASTVARRRANALARADMMLDAAADVGGRPWPVPSCDAECVTERHADDEGPSRLHHLQVQDRRRQNHRHRAAADLPPGRCGQATRVPEDADRDE